VCRICHTFLHRVRTNQELGENFNSIETLRKLKEEIDEKIKKEGEGQLSLHKNFLLK
jgi:hypothetical protein